MSKAKKKTSDKVRPFAMNFSDDRAVIFSDTKTINTAAGRIFRQESIICYSEEAPRAEGHQITWFRSYYQGKESGYRWIIPTPPGRYTFTNSKLFRQLESLVNTTQVKVHKERLFNGTVLTSVKDVLSYTQGFDFDFAPSVVSEYINDGYWFIGAQLLATFKPVNGFYRIVSNPIRIKTQTIDRRIVYPMKLTGSSQRKTSKSTELRLYIITRYRLARTPAFLRIIFEGVVEFDLGDWYVTILEGSVSQRDMKDDIVLELDRDRPFYD